MKTLNILSNRLHKIVSISVLLAIMIILAGCKKLIDVNAPYTSLNAGNVYTSDATAASVLTNTYAVMSDNDNGIDGIPSLYLYGSLSADELTLYATSTSGQNAFYINSLSAVSGSGTQYWRTIYPQIFIYNSAIEGLTASSSLTPAVKTELLGEAKFMRALSYFYLVNLYGDVPLVTSTDYKINALLPRTSKSDVYAQIVKDLNEAINALSAVYLKADALTPYPAGGEERTRPTKWAAYALLARSYLFMGQYANAETAATAVINNFGYYSLTTLNNVFLKNNKEAIWQLQPVYNANRSNTGEGYMFVLLSVGPNTNDNPVYLSSTVLNAFESGDQRAINWVGNVKVGTTTYYYPNKYKIGNVSTTTQEYSTVFRLAEQYLIRAEARAQLNNISGAQTDLNMIRTRAGLPNTAASTTATLQAAIMHERQVELFTEYGHRWLDLKRTGTIDAVMGTGGACAAKGGVWNTIQQLYPIPQSELTTDPNLTQNPGY